MEDEAFLNAIRAAPDDVAVKLIYADWLDEQDDIRGEFIRLEHQLANLPQRLKFLEDQIDATWLRAVSHRRTAKTNGSPTADWLWDVMAAAQQDREKLRPILEAMSEERLEDFYDEYRNAAYELYPSHEYPERSLWRDEVLNAAEWVVAQGREWYDAVWANPRLIPHPDTIVRLSFLALAQEIFYERFGREANR